MPRTHFSPLLLTFSIVPLLLASLAAAQAVVTQQPATVEVRTFDPHNPPADMPALTPPEAAVTRSNFACGVEVEVEITEPSSPAPKMKVTGVKARLTLENVIWLPTDAPAKLKAHEQGHRQISETLYQRGEPAAKKLAQGYIGRAIPIQSADPSHTQPAIAKVASQFCQEYLAATEGVAQKVQERYDKLTEHGKNKVGEQQAIERALREAGVTPAAGAASRSATRPSTSR